MPTAKRRKQASMAALEAALSSGMYPQYNGSLGGIGLCMIVQVCISVVWSGGRTPSYVGVGVSTVELASPILHVATARFDSVQFLAMMPIIEIKTDFVQIFLAQISLDRLGET